VSALLQTGRWLAFGGFALLLVGLGVGLLRARRQLLEDEVDARLETEFRKLERELQRDAKDGEG
jgi:hypothetical protein